MFLLKPLLSRRAGRPGQLSSARLSCVGTYCTRKEETESISERKCSKEDERDCEKEGEGGHSVNKAAKDCGSQQQGDRGA